jgi:hypothetical protein
LGFYERFALPQSPDPQTRLEAARASTRVGAIRFRLGENNAAEQAYRQAIGVLSGLVSDHPAELAYREALAQAHQELSAVFRNQLDWNQTERELKEVAALWEALARERPEVARYRSKLADAHGSVGDMYWRRGRTEESSRELRWALDAAERLARENPEVSDYQQSLAIILQYFGNLQSVIKDGPGGLATRQRQV